MLAHKWRGDAFLWDSMTAPERAELFALDRFIESKRGGKKDAGVTANMDKAQRIAEFQRRLKAQQEG